MTSPIKQLLSKYHFRPAKKLGQHFLISKNVLQKIIEAADLTQQNTILEIGPGLGILTVELAKRVKKVIAIEKDTEICRILKDILEKKDIKNIQIINQNILDYESKTKNYKLVANLPYYIASPIIRKFLENKQPPEKMILMVQKEVAQRIVAKPPQMSILAVSIQFYAEPRIIDYVPKEAFWPAPKVDSAIIEIKPFRKRPDHCFIQKFFRMVKAGFVAPRKQIANNLSKNLKIDRQKIENILSEYDIDPKRRAETLTVNDWKNLVSLL